MALCDPCLETRGIAVQHEFLGEIHVRENGVRMAVLADIDVDVRVAADDDMRAVTAAGGRRRGGPARGAPNPCAGRLGCARRCSPQ